jgi:hypothetical protein
MILSRFDGVSTHNETDLGNGRHNINFSRFVPSCMILLFSTFIQLFALAIMKNRPTNEHIKQQAQRANDYAEQNENSRRRGSGTFEDLELDQAQTPDRVDQSNWSWTESGSQQYQEGK